MATVKVTFTLDEATVARLRQAAQRLARPKSQVVREAIYDYSERIGRLGDHERLRLLRVVDEIAARQASRPLPAVEAELKSIRTARRGGGRRSAVGRRR